MRIIAALVMLVSSIVSCHAEDWVTVHNSGLKAIDKRDFETALTLFQKSVALATTTTERAVSANDLGVVFHQLCRDPEAHVWLSRALESWKSLPVKDPRYGETAGALAMVDRMLGSYKEAEDLLKEAIATPALSGDSRSSLLSEEGDLLREEGRFSEAHTLIEQAKNTPGASAKQMVYSEIALAELDRDTQNWDASVDEWDKATALAHQDGYSGAEAVCQRGLGQTWMDRGNYARAEPLLRAALALFESDTVRDDAQIATTQASIGELYLAEDKTGLAEEALRHALAGDERSLGPSHPQIAIVLEALAQTVALRNQGELARDYMQRAQKIMVGRFGEHSPVAAGVLANWGELEQRLKNPDGAAAQYKKALDNLRDSGPDLDQLRAQIIRQYAGVLKATHHKREAEALLAETKTFR